MKVCAVVWKDITETNNCNASDFREDPLIELVSIGIYMGRFQDKDGMNYIKLCFKKALDDTKGNDDIISIPIGCIKKILDVGTVKT